MIGWGRRGIRTRACDDPVAVGEESALVCRLRRDGTTVVVCWNIEHRRTDKQFSMLIEHVTCGSGNSLRADVVCHHDYLLPKFHVDHPTGSLDSDHGPLPSEKVFLEIVMFTNYQN